MKMPAPIESLKWHLTRIDPAVSLRVDEPALPIGDWWLDFQIKDWWLTVRWNRRAGFGIYTVSSNGYGDKPNEIYRSPGVAARRIYEIVENARVSVDQARGRFEELQKNSAAAQIPLVSVIVPVFNEGANIVQIYDLIHSASFSDGESEMIFVDCGSTDNSAAQLERLAREKTTVSYFFAKRGTGHEELGRVALSHAKGLALLIVRADFDGSAETLSNMISAYTQGWDVVFAEEIREKIPFSWIFPMRAARFRDRELVDTFLMDRRVVQKTQLATDPDSLHSAGFFVTKIPYQSQQSIELETELEEMKLRMLDDSRRTTVLLMRALLPLVRIASSLARTVRFLVKGHG
jgi:hypothetical protein